MYQPFPPMGGRSHPRLLLNRLRYLQTVAHAWLRTVAHACPPDSSRRNATMSPSKRRRGRSPDRWSSDMPPLDALSTRHLNHHRTPEVFAQNDLPLPGHLPYLHVFSARSTRRPTRHRCAEIPLLAQVTSVASATGHCPLFNMANGSDHLGLHQPRSVFLRRRCRNITVHPWCTRRDDHSPTSGLDDVHYFQGLHRAG